MIYGSTYPNDNYETTLQTGYIPPETFIFLDQKRYRMKIIYHIPRRSCNKKILFPPKTDSKNKEISWRYSMAIPKIDIEDDYKNNTKTYW